MAPVLSLALLTACSDDGPDIVDPINGDDPNGETDETIVDIAQGNEDFSILVDLVIDADLVDVLATEELTVFAPTNDAFETLFETVNPDDLTQEDIIEILTYHVTEGTILSNALDAQQDVTMLNEERTLVQVNGGVIINGSASVVQADVQASNGVIHAIDEVLLPSGFREASIVEVAEDAGNYEQLLALVEDAGLTTTLQFTSGLTVFAPDDDAFDALFDAVDPSELSADDVMNILTYHVLTDGPIFAGDLAPEQTVDALSGEALYIVAENGDVTINWFASVQAADIEAANGVIHSIDAVLLPNAFQDITEIAIKNYNLTTLVDLLVEYDLVETLQEDGPYTVFAPTNDAFEEIMGAVAELTDEEIVDILLYHVLDLEVLSGDLEEEQTVEALNGSEMTIVVENGTVVINGSATVEVADLQGTNGVVHIVDEVLLPEEEAESDATITINNVGQSAWELVDIEGDGASGDIGEENAPITLEAERRYTFVNQGAANHPFQLRDGNGDVLIAANTDGSLQDYEPANVQISDDGETISFTLTGNLADWVATYNCAPHAAMEGDIIVN